MKIWKTCIYFQFHLILVVNVDTVFNNVPIKRLLNYLPRIVSRMYVLYLHKRMKGNKAKETSNRWYKKQRERSRGS